MAGLPIPFLDEMSQATGQDPTSPGGLDELLTKLSIKGGLANAISGGQQARADAVARHLGEGLKDVVTPGADDLSYQLQSMVNEGNLDPQMAATILANPSLMANVTTDPHLVQSQMQALSQLQNLSSQGGLDAQARAQLEQAKGDVNNYERGQRESLLSNAAERGLSNSNLSFASQLANQQGAASRLNQSGVQAASDAEMRALDALKSGAGLASDVRNQSFNEQSQKAAAQDAINKFNAANQQQVALANVGAKNQAQAANLANKQSISNQNTQLANQGLQNQSAAQQQTFQNQLALQQQKDAAAQAKAQIAMGIGGQNTDLFGNALSGVATVGAGAAKSDRNSKKDVRVADFDIEDFLGDLTGYRYKYKDPSKDGEGEHISPMAQDLQKSEIGKKMVIPTEDGLMVDYGKLEPGEMLSMFANLNKRIQHLEGK